PGPRPAARRLDLHARLPGDPGADARLRADRRPAEPPLGPRVRGDRPARPARLMATRQELLLAQHAGRLQRRARGGRRWSHVTLWTGVGIVAIVAVAAIFAPWIAPYPPNEQNLLASFEPPSWSHLMGTDNLGRDVFSRVVWAGRVDLQIGL